MRELMERPVREARGGGRGRLDRVPTLTAKTATHRALFADENERRCDVCDAVIAAHEETGGSGLYVWTRGEETRYEEPPLCTTCGPELGLFAFRRWDAEEEEEG